MLLIVRRIGKRYYFKIIINWSNRKGLSTFSIWSSNLQHPERPDTGLRMFLSLRQLDPSLTSHLYLEDWVLASMCSPPRPAQNWYILSIHKVLITYTWVILHIPSQLLSAHRQSQAAQQSHHRRLWTIDGSGVPAFSLNSPCRAWQLSPYRPVTCLANLPAPSDICGPGPGAAIFRVTVTAGGDTRRVTAGLYGETESFARARDMTAAALIASEAQLVLRAESSSLIYRLIVWTRVSREQDDIFTLDQSTTWVGTTQR